MVANVNEARYSVALWDHDLGRWSYKLAKECIAEHPNGLTWRGIGVALRMLRAQGWEPDTSIYVSRDKE